MDLFRIHPAIGIARVGNSREHVIAPESMAGRTDSADPTLMGGLPIRAGTERDVVSASDLRDTSGALKRHAARFRIFQYDDAGLGEAWPRGDGTEIAIGATVGGKTVSDIVWTVHVANKKANTFILVEDPLKSPGVDNVPGIGGFENGLLPTIRNPDFANTRSGQPPIDKRIDTLNQPDRVRRLTIDPGPRAISGADTPEVRFDRATTASYCDPRTGEIVSLAAYPKSFPRDSFKDMDLDAPAGPIDTLGELQTDEKGRLLVLAGYGRAVGWKINGAAPLDDDVNNDQWFDDTSDGPVTATIVFEDGSHVEAQHAWVATTDPSVAPQILNIVSLWDDIYDCWVRNLDLAPALYADGDYKPDFRPSFDDDLQPIFRSVALQQWIANLSNAGASAHARVGAITAIDDPGSTEISGLVATFRNPFTDGDQGNTALMPLVLGDANESFLTLRKTQYFMLTQWDKGSQGFHPGPGPALGPGEYLDKATLVNCLGGRFSPGIDLTFTMRESALYVQPWQTSGYGPFRIHRTLLDYAALPADTPVLGCGYVPRHAEANGLEPGDLTKFLALPWHTDYNSCATHPPSPNPAGNRKVFWSWPAQRPVAVYAATDVSLLDTTDGAGNPIKQPILGTQRWSMRGQGTDSGKPENWGRYQDREDILDNWHRLGVVVQAPAVDNSGIDMPADWYLEVQSQLRDTGLTPVVPFPNYATETDADTLDPRQLFYQLLNVDDHPQVLVDARNYVDYWLNWAQDFSNGTTATPVDQRFFPYTEQAFKDRLELIYQELVDVADTARPYDPDQFIKTHADVVIRIKQMAPFNLVDGAWLRNIGRTGPIDEVRSLLFSVWMDEVGDGDVSMNHCNIYRDLCHSVGYYPAPIESQDFAFDLTFLDSAFTVPAFQLAISQFSEDYYPELIGMTLQLEWEVVDLKPTRDLLEYFNVDPHFYVMHIGIDNAVNGHGQRAADAVGLYLNEMRRTGGEEAVQTGWRRIWNGFVAFGSIGTFGQDLQDLITTPPTLREQMIALIERKADFGSRNHQEYKIGDCRINDWFDRPSEFLDALEQQSWLTPGDWANSRFRQLLEFMGGPMFRVFTQDEIDLWDAYTVQLGRPKPTPPIPEPRPPARAMADVIDQLRPVQQGSTGHQGALLADAQGMAHTVAWWFALPGEEGTHALMAALASPLNQLITPGEPGNSRFLSQLIAPSGPMGSFFDLPARAPNVGSCRDVVYRWITARCPLPAPTFLSLRLNTPAAKREGHATGRVVGMGTIH